MSSTTKEEQKPGIVNQIGRLKEKADNLVDLAVELDNRLNCIASPAKSDEHLVCRENNANCQLEDDLTVLYEKLDQVHNQLASLEERIQL